MDREGLAEEEASQGGGHFWRPSDFTRQNRGLVVARRAKVEREKSSAWRFRCPFSMPKASLATKETFSLWNADSLLMGSPGLSQQSQAAGTVQYL